MKRIVWRADLGTLPPAERRNFFSDPRTLWTIITIGEWKGSVQNKVWGPTTWLSFFPQHLWQSISRTVFNIAPSWKRFIIIILVFLAEVFNTNIRAK